MRKHTLAVAAIAMLALAATPACVSKKLFRKNVAQTDSRVAGVESAVEENERRISDLSQETDARIAEVDARAEKAVEIGSNAMSKAEAANMTAERAVRGKLLWEVTLSDDRVKFSFDDANLSDAAKAELDSLAAEIRSMGKALYLEIEGHTDSIGSEEYNVMLGEKRANAVMKYLNTSGGIPLHAMNTISYGSSRAVADNGTKAGRAQNRRVVIRVLE